MPTPHGDRKRRRFQQSFMPRIQSRRMKFRLAFAIGSLLLALGSGIPAAAAAFAPSTVEGRRSRSHAG
jgi:hypothetical protein